MIERVIMFKNIRLSTILFIGFALLTSLVMLVSYMGYSGLNEFDDSFQVTQDLEGIAQGSYEVRQLSQEYLMTGSDRIVGNVNVKLGQINTQVDETKARMDDPESIALMDEVSVSVDNYKDNFLEYVSLEAKQDILKGQLDQNANRVIANAETVKELETQEYESILASGGSSISIQERSENIEIANDLIISVMEMQVVEKEYLLSKSPESRDMLSEKMNDVNYYSEELESSINNPDAQNYVKGISIYSKGYSTAVNEFASIEKNKDTIYTQMLESLDEMIVVVEDAQLQQIEVAETGMSSSVSKMFYITIISFILSAILSLSISRIISNSINDMLSMAHRISEGDLSVSIKTGSKNEMGRLASSLQTMTDNLKGIIEDVRENSLQVAATAQELSASSEEMAASSDQISINVTGISAGAKTQSSKCMDVYGSMRSVADSMQTVSSNAEEAARTAFSAKDVAGSVRHNTEELAIKMNRMKEAITDSSMAMQKLGQKSQEIEVIVDMITKITEQTTLLSFNAAIEAAHAGEHGRGFAVVADEVRKLSNNSAVSAKQISKIITEINEETQHAVDSILEGSSEVETSVSSLEDTMTSIIDIVESINEMSSVIEDISRSAREHYASLGQVSVSVEEITGISKESAAHSEEAASSVVQQTAAMSELARSSHDLATMAESLQQSISLFKLESGIEYPGDDSNNVIISDRPGSGQSFVPERVRSLLKKTPLNERAMPMSDLIMRKICYLKNNVPSGSSSIIKPKMERSITNLKKLSSRENKKMTPRSRTDPRVLKDMLMRSGIKNKVSDLDKSVIQKMKELKNKIKDR